MLLQVVETVSVLAVVLELVH